ncbi:hypothetical protein FGIG_00021 [Fasciola gigantica]|uniref:Kinesin-like protein KIF26A/B helical domain-containing protein n=1 Tax=Fasciola gigantica TaxID=46835 RepID=A0A504YMH8_FASGI|nr:hypothetical protein FGIG_00021 [Fasciola gigantica]
MGSLNLGLESTMSPPLPPRPTLPPIIDVRIKPRLPTRLTPDYNPPRSTASTLRHMLQSGCADPSVTRCITCLRSLQDLVRQAYELVVQESPNSAILLKAVPLSASCVSNLSDRLRMPEHSLIRASDGRCASCATAVAQLKLDALEHVRNSILSLPANKLFRGFQRVQAYTKSRFPLCSATKTANLDRSDGNIM